MPECGEQTRAVLAERGGRSRREHDAVTGDGERLVRLALALDYALHVERVVEALHKVDEVRRKHLRPRPFNRATKHVENSRGALAVRIHALVDCLRDKPPLFKRRHRVVRVKFIEEFLDVAGAVVVRDVHIKVGEIALAVACRKQLLAHSVVAFKKRHLDIRRQSRRKEQSRRSAANDNHVKFQIFHTPILA